MIKTALYSEPACNLKELQSRINTWLRARQKIKKMEFISLTQYVDNDIVFISIVYKDIEKIE